MKIYFRMLTPGGASLEMALDTLGTRAWNTKVADPANIPPTFTTPTTAGGGLAVASLAPGFVQAVWVRRRGLNGPAIRPERNTITATGTTPA